MGPLWGPPQSVSWDSQRVQGVKYQTPMMKPRVLLGFVLGCVRCVAATRYSDECYQHPQGPSACAQCFNSNHGFCCKGRDRRDPMIGYPGPLGTRRNHRKTAEDGRQHFCASTEAAAGRTPLCMRTPYNDLRAIPRLV